MSRAIIIAGTGSGSGKTTVALGLMAAFVRRGITVQPFKCGPDFIDPSLHKLVTGRVSRNLDLWMAGEEFTRKTFALHGTNADISIIEGVMGMFDGGESSSAALAAKLGIPLILVLDVRSTAESAAAIVKGFETLSPKGSLCGVILNRVASARHLQLVSAAVARHCRAEILGHLPGNMAFAIPERHLGLHMGEESPLSEDGVAELAETVRQHVDLERLMILAETGVLEQENNPDGGTPATVRLAVARDRAFCFYYEDNLDILRQAGAELVFFSPLADKKLPDNIHGIYLGGGYPELYAVRLSANREMLAAVRRWAENRGVIYGECGGFMYLTEGITGLDGVFWPMAGIFPGRTYMQNSRASLGYREVRLREDGLFGPAGTVMRGHEFHYSRLAGMADSVKKIYAVNNGAEEGYCCKNVLGGYMHLHFGFNPAAAAAMVYGMGKNGRERT